MKVAQWMHAFDIAHGDLKPENVLLKRLDSTPTDPRVAYCVVQINIWQIVFGD